MAAPMAIPLVAPARLAAFRRFARALALRRAMFAAAVAGWACLTGPALARSAQAKVPARIVTSDGDFPGQLPPFAADTEAQNKPAGADMLAATPALTTTFASALSPEPEPDTAVAIAQAVVQRTVQATPVTALPPDPASAVSCKDQAGAAALRAWAGAWAAKDINAYLSSYGQNFAPPGMQAREAWEEVRRARIAGKSSISVTLSDLSIAVQANQATARFRQDYSADGLNISSRKTLDLVKGVDERWLIVREATGR
jgi:ketosteroid isomerase-like protein